MTDETKMTALTRAREYLATLEGDGRTRYAGHPDSILAALVAELEAAPTGQSLGAVVYHDDERFAADNEGQTVRLLAQGGRDGGC